MATFKPSKYQQLVYTYIQRGHGNAVIDAVAGSGKSTTIVNALKLIPSDKSILFLAFNKSIVTELKAKIGNLPNVDVRTLHSLGVTSINKSLRCQIDEDKYRSWINKSIEVGAITPNSKLSKESEGEWKSNIIKLVDLGRSNLAITNSDLVRLSEKHDILVLDNEINIAIRAIKWGEAYTSTIDYTDMIYYPNVKNIRMPQYDWVFIDECQDLNAAQREMFLKCIKPVTGRFVAVGDPRQAIYGFAGADVESFNLLKAVPHTAKLPLSICYRCDKSIITAAQRLVPQIQWRDNAEDGEIASCSVNDVKDGDMVLCRNTAPIVGLCMNYIAKGVKAYVKGRDIGTNLINMLKQTNTNSIEKADQKFNRELGRIIGKVVTKTRCSEEEAREASVYKTYEDKADAIRVIAIGAKDVQEVISRIDRIFKDTNNVGICLSTIHKSKGLEADRVFVLCPEKLYPKRAMNVPWMAEQEANLEYVMITRAKHYLGYITDYEC